MTKPCTVDVMAALMNRYETGKWVKIPEASTPSGRRCDLVAFGIWRNTKNRIIGHEVKVSRADWQKELDSPEKSDAVIPFCHSWFIVAPKGLIQLEELRASWGLLEMLPSGSMKIRRQAEIQKDVKPLPPRIIGEWMRRIEQRTTSSTVVDAIVKTKFENLKASYEARSD
ncbi:MAG: hypothetical protein AAF989_14410, partial [Planctomycetota bacterium]